MEIVVAALIVLLVALAFVASSIARENRYLENRCDSLERQVEWLTCSYDLEAAEPVPTATCTSCGQVSCPHPTAVIEVSP